MDDFLDKAPVDIFDDSGKLLLAKGREISPTAYKRIKKYIQEFKITSEEEAETFDVTRYCRKIVSRQDFSLPLPTIDWNGLAGKLPKGNPEFVREAGHCLAECLEKVKLNDLLYIYLMGMASFVDWIYSHSVNVALLTIMLAKKMKLVNLTGLALGALFHDVGKLLIPKEILNKPAELTAEEAVLMKQHTSLGRDMLTAKGIDFPIPMIAAQHHERLDGQGYPSGLCRGQIHVYAQIVGFADTFDALTSARPYRPGCSPEEALNIIVNDGGYNKFNPTIIKAGGEIIKS